MFEELQFKKWNAASAELAQRIITDPRCRVLSSNASFRRPNHQRLNEIRFGWPRGQNLRCIGYIQEVKSKPGIVWLFLHLAPNAKLIKPAGPFEDASKGQKKPSESRKRHTDDDLGKLLLSADSFSDEVFDWIDCAIKNTAEKAGIKLPHNWQKGQSVVKHSTPIEVDAIFSAREGKRLLRVHRTIERNREVVNAKKTLVISTTGDLKCEICSFSFRETFDGHGEGFAECHHVKPLAELTEETLTTIADLAIVCANCHRMLHRCPFPPMDYLRQLRKKP